MIDHRKVRRAVAEHKEPDCTHPTDQIMDRPDKSYCRKCGQDVPQLMRKVSEFREYCKDLGYPCQEVPLGSPQTARDRKSVFPVFPSADDA